MLLCLFAAFMSLCMILLHTFWGIIIYDGLHMKRYYQPIAVVLSHMLVSCLVGILHTFTCKQ
jgi:anterior pharynx defective protein 1